MGKGICADSYVGNRELQELFRLRMGGSGELPIDIRRRLDRQEYRQLKRHHKKTARANEQKGFVSYE